MLIDSATARVRLFHGCVTFGLCFASGLSAVGCAPSAQSSVQARPAVPEDENSKLERVFIGHAAPPLDGLLSVGGQAAPHWRALRGRVVVLDFWAPWCGVCHLVADELNQWQQEFGDRLRVIGISAGSLGAVTKFAPRLHMEYLVAADPNAVVSKEYLVSAVPMVFVVDPAGVIRAVHMGYSSQRLSTMKQLVLQLVSQQ